jgi:hypothetical protein
MQGALGRSRRARAHAQQAAGSHSRQQAASRQPAATCHAAAAQQRTQDAGGGMRRRRAHCGSCPPAHSWEWPWFGGSGLLYFWAGLWTCSSACAWPFGAALAAGLATLRPGPRPHSTHSLSRVPRTTSSSPATAPPRGPNPAPGPWYRWGSRWCPNPSQPGARPGQSCHVKWVAGRL